MSNQLTLDEFRNTPAGLTVAKVLGRIPFVEMDALSRAGRPAVLALDAALPTGLHLEHNEKQHAGRMIRIHMRDHGWRVVARRQFRGGRFFSSGAVYEPVTMTTPAAPSTRDWMPGSDDARQRIAEAQEIIRRGSSNNYSVDDFIRDKRTEAIRESVQDARNGAQ